MLLVERQVSGDAAALVMTMVKGAGLAGAFLGGWMGDRFGLKKSLVLSFVLSGIGLGLLPLAHALSLITVLAMIASLGGQMFPSTARLYLALFMSVSEQRESFGWLRMVNNLGQVVSFGVSWAFAGLGIAPLMLLDSAASLVAAGVSGRTLEDRRPVSERSTSETTGSHSTPTQWQPGQLKTLVLATLMVAAMGCLYELYLVGAAAKFKLLYGAQGLVLFSQVMLMNTLLCAFLAVAATRWIQSPAFAMPVGFLMVGTGCALTFIGEPTQLKIFGGALALTLGEIIYMSMSGFVIVRLTPDGGRQGSIYGMSQFVQILGRVLGASIAFLTVVIDHHSALTLGVITGIGLALWMAARPGVLRIVAQSG